ncbi:MAG: dihydroneopterin aldolase [Phycisphaerales bacterium]|jgi:dihydroneopterin aldolase/D-erythro-7,8-dihydroneopterin triphosphate epimerase
MTDDTAFPTSDRIFIRDLAIRCIIGVDELERREKQELLVQIELQVDLRRAGRTDALADSVDYSSLKRQVLEAAENSQYRLIEALAQRIADECLKRQRVECVRVIVEKPGVLRFARTVGVEIVRRRGGSE